ncbi:MAG: hypothetical protein LUE92_13870 [Clostridiales bacterium]|nr:hypothetical protein [Clostridiales bacterium]
MGETEDKNLLELLETYMDMVEKQDEIILHMSELLKEYAREVQHLRNLNAYFEEDDKLLARQALLEESVEQYQIIKNVN